MLQTELNKVHLTLVTPWGKFSLLVAYLFIYLHYVAGWGCYSGYRKWFSGFPLIAFGLQLYCSLTALLSIDSEKALVK